MYHGPESNSDLCGGQFRQVGDSKVMGEREEDWRLRGEEGGREFTMREWQDKERWITRKDEGGEWDLRTGKGWEEGGVINTVNINTDVRDEKTEEEISDDVCCCDEITGVKILVTIFAVSNLGIIATGGVGFTLGLVDYWSEQDLFISVMVGYFCHVCLQNHQ